MRHHFIPTKENDYRPHILQKSAVIAMGVLILLTFAIANIQTFVWTSSDWLVSTVLPAVIVTETNQARAEQDLGGLRRSEVLDKVATDKAEDMVANQYFAHFSPTGISPWYWFDKEGYNFVHAGENLAVHFTDSKAVVEAWLNSPSHRANIMNENYREIGVGIARGRYQGFDTIFVVQEFGTPARVVAERPRSTQPDPTTLNESEVAIANDTTPEAQVAGEQSPEPPATQPEQASSELHTTTTVDTSGDHTVVVSDHMSTSTGATPATIHTDGNDTSQTKASWLGVTTQPKQVLEAIYLLVGLFVVVCLLLSIVIEIRHQRPVQIGYGTGLLVLMYVLLQIHLSMIGGVVVL